MDVIKIIGYLLISAFSLEVMIESFYKIINSKRKINIFYILILLLGSIIVTINFYYSSPAYKMFINILVTYVVLILISKENLSKTIVINLILYFILFVAEILTSSFVMITNIVDPNMVNTNILIKALITLINQVFLFFICTRKSIINFISRIVSKIKNNSIIITIVLLSTIVLFISDLRFYNTLSTKIYLSNVIILGCLMIIIILTIKAYLNNFKEQQKMEALLSFMSKYEKTIDEDRINKHELLNDLLILKSLNKNNSKEYNELLNNLIDKFTNKGIKIKNVYKLPSGLKGILYYKLYGLEEKGYDININVSNKTINLLKKINNNDYINLNKIVGIVIDNAIEASSKTNNKYILIDIYNDNGIVIEISNSFKGKVDINSINDKYYSTKGKNRGLGLFIINKLIKSSNISYEQIINDSIFTTIIKIKK